MSPSAKKPYGIQRACRAWKLARATVQRHKALAEDAPRIPAKRGPKTFLSAGQILAEIRPVLASTLFVGEGHRKVWARLRQERGVRTSMRRVLRIMREHGIRACDRPTGVRGPEAHDRTTMTETPGKMWAIDATGCLTDGGVAAVFVIIDHCTGECLRAHAGSATERPQRTDGSSAARPREHQLQLVSETGCGTSDQSPRLTYLRIGLMLGKEYPVNNLRAKGGQRAKASWSLDSQKSRAISSAG
jgi:transposase InsO family protein